MHIHKSVITLTCILWSMLLFSQGPSEEEDKHFIHIDASREQWTISPYINGSHFVYAFENDRLYEDEQIAEWMRRSGVHVIRWPGGTAVQHYHWDDLNGIAFREDSWDPDYNQQAKDPSEFMDLDEFIAYCRKVGAEPMVGVNIRSGRVYNRDADGLDEAKRLIEYCKKNDYNVKYWYIGNEGYASGFSSSLYTEYVDKYAKVLRSVDPDIVIIGDWKFGPRRKNRFYHSIDIVRESEHIDMMEYHEKWGNPWGLQSGHSFNDWKNEFPIYNGALSDYIRRFRHEMREIGKSHIKIGFNEWGIGEFPGGTPFEYALIAADYLLEMYRNDVYMACYWNLNMGSKDTRVFVTNEDNSRVAYFNPVALVFEMLGDARKQTFLYADCTRKDVYGFAAKNKADGKITLYLLNKSDDINNVELMVENFDFVQDRVHIQSLKDPGVIENHYITNGSNSNTITFDLLPLSFNKIELNAYP